MEVDEERIRLEALAEELAASEDDGKCKQVSLLFVFNIDYL